MTINPANNMDFNFLIEQAKISDLEQVRLIYKYYIEKTTASLEERALNYDEMLNIYSNVMAKNLPFLVAKFEGRVIGYCYAGPYRNRSAYRYTIEESVYVHQDYLGKGVATSLLTEVIRKCKEVGYKQMIAIVVQSENEQSVKFHKRMGFEEKGKLNKVGYKFDNWVDTVLFQKEL